MQPDPSPAALTQLLEHRAWVRDLARRLVVDSHAAADLEQETWIAAMKRPPDAERDPRPWLRRVLTNLARNQRRAAGRRRFRETTWREARHVRSPDEALASADQHRRLVARLMELEEPHRTVLVLRFFEGHKPGEIARQLGVSAGTIYSRIHRALEQMRARLDEDTDGDRTRWQAGLVSLAGLKPEASASAATGVAAGGGLLMSLSKPGLLVPALAVLLLVGLGVGVLLHEPDDAPAEDVVLQTASDAATPSVGPTLEAPRARAAASPANTDAASKGETAPAEVPATRAETRGRVLDSSGRPVAGAHVLVMPQAVRGLSKREAALPRYGAVQTDELGRFRLRSDGIENAKLVVQAPGWMPATAAVGGGELTLTLEAPWHVSVRVEDEAGQWPRGCTVYVDTDDDLLHTVAGDARDASFYKMLEPRAPEEIERTVAVTTLAPLDVRPVVADGFAAWPRRIRLEPHAKEAAFRIVPTAKIHVDIVDAETHKAHHEDQLVLVQLREAGRDTMFDSTSATEGVVHFENDLSPDRYEILVEAPGYRPLRTPVVVATPGEVVDVRLALERLPPAERLGRVLLKLLRTGQAAPRVLELAGTDRMASTDERCIVLFRPSGTLTWEDGEAVAGPDGRLEVRPGIAATQHGLRGTGLAPGAYDLIVAERGTGMAAFVKGVRVLGDRVNAYDVQLRPGTLLRLPDVAGRDTAWQTIEIGGAAIGRLPVYSARLGDAPLLGRGSARTELLSAPLMPLVLGPFPTASVTVALTDAKGTRKTFEIEGAPKAR